jgi:hypothetical protein
MSNSSKRDRPEIKMHGDSTDIFISVDGVKIAKRGQPGTPQARTWIPLEPGWTVRDCPYPGKIEVEYQGSAVGTVH